MARQAFDISYFQEVIFAHISIPVYIAPGRGNAFGCATEDGNRRKKWRE